MSVTSRNYSTTSWTPDSTRGKINLTPSNNESLTMYPQDTTEDTIEPYNVTTQDMNITMTTPSFKHHQLSFVFIIQMGKCILIYLWNMRFVLSKAYYYEEMHEDTKGVIINSISKNDNDQKKNDEKTMFHKTLQTQLIKDWATRIPLSK